MVKTYCSLAILAESKLAVQMALLKSDKEEPIYNYLDESEEPRPALIDSFCNKIKVRMPVLEPTNSIQDNKKSVGARKHIRRNISLSYFQSPQKSITSE